MAKKSPSLAEALVELEALTAWFESGEIELEEGLKKFERGLMLTTLCKQKIAEVENKVIEIKQKFTEL